MQVVLASGNRGKLREFDTLLAPLGIEVVSQGALGIEAGPETGATFLENALQKARHASDQAGLAAIADDSGLVVPALGGAPGIYSARYAGEGADDAQNNAKLIEALAGVANRHAYFYCALVFINDSADPAPLVATAAWHGEVIDTPRGANGFGYDPHFWLPELGVCSAELEPAEKNRRSHRGQASTTLIEQLRARQTP